MLILAKKTNPAALTAVCQGLRGINKQHRWLWDTLESLPGVDVAASRASLKNRLCSLTSSVTTGFGGVKERNELAPTCPSSVDLVSSWAAGIMREWTQGDGRGGSSPREFGIVGCFAGATTQRSPPTLFLNSKTWA